MFTGEHDLAMHCRLVDNAMRWTGGLRAETVISPMSVSPTSQK
jgi:hypothetical protein